MRSQQAPSPPQKSAGKNVTASIGTQADNLRTEELLAAVDDTEKMQIMHRTTCKVVPGMHPLQYAMAFFENHTTVVEFIEHLDIESDGHSPLAQIGI